MEKAFKHTFKIYFKKKEYLLYIKVKILLSGFMMPLFMYLPYYTLSFTLTNCFHRWFDLDFKSYNSKFLCGIFASSLSLILYIPPELLKTKA